MTPSLSLPSLDDLTRAERGVSLLLAAVIVFLVAAVAIGWIRAQYLLFLLSLGGMYLILSMGLNVQWGYTGLINFSVAAFFGLGAYGTALLTANSSPIAGGFNPIVGLVMGLLLAAVVAILIGIPTLQLRADYLAIASLGLAEVIRMIVLNEQQWTNGSRGVTGIPTFFEGWPVLGSLSDPFTIALADFGLVVVFILVVYLFLRRIHRSPWGRVQRTIRADEDLAEALGKNTYWFKMQSFVIGSVIMALAGVFYVHLNLYLGPGDLNPIRTFYVWVAVILGGSGSNRGAMFGGFTVIAILEGTRFLNGLQVIPFDIAPFRLLVIGILIILIMHLRPEGVLPPQKELIWPSAMGGESDE